MSKNNSQSQAEKNIRDRSTESYEAYFDYPLEYEYLNIDFTDFESENVYRALQIRSDFVNLSHIAEKFFPTIEEYPVRMVYFQWFCNEVAEARIRLYEELIGNDELNDLVQAMFKEDFWFWANAEAWTYNPINAKSEAIPMVLFFYQIDYYEKCMEHASTIVIKGRGLGFTWLKAIITVWRLRYEPSYDGMMNSRVEDDVDKKGDRKHTTFGRMRFILEHLYDWEESYIVDKKMDIQMKNGNTFIGMSSNPDAPRSKRGTEFQVEESGVMENFDEVMAAILSVANEIRIGGSVKGTKNGFYEYWKNKDNKYYHIFWHWSMSPLYRDPELGVEAKWYLGEKKRYSIQKLKQEIDVDWFASLANAVLSELDPSKHLVDLYSQDFGNCVPVGGIDPGAKNTGVWMGFYDLSREVLYLTDSFSVSGAQYDEIAKEIKDRNFDKAYFFIDEFAQKTSLQSRSTLEELFTDEGLIVIPISNRNINASAQRANKMLRGGRIFFDDSNGDVIDGVEALTRYVFRDPFTSDAVKKDESSDLGDAFRYMIDGILTIDTDIQLEASSRFKDNRVSTGGPLPVQPSSQYSRFGGR